MVKKLVAVLLIYQSCIFCAVPEVNINETRLVNICCKVTEYIFTANKATGFDNVKCSGSFDTFLASIRKREKTSSFFREVLDESHFYILNKNNDFPDTLLESVIYVSVNKLKKENPENYVGITELNADLDRIAGIEETEKNNKEKENKFDSKEVSNLTGEKKAGVTDNSGTMGVFYSKYFYIALGTCILILIFFIIRKSGEKKNNVNSEKIIPPELNRPENNAAQTVKDIAGKEQKPSQRILKEIEFQSKDYIVVGSSVMGKSHTGTGIPCQDYHLYKQVKEGWIIAVVCDGAGSADNSHLGSKFVSESVIAGIEKMIPGRFIDENIFLNENNSWEKLAETVLINARNELMDYAKKINVPFKSLACTVIAVVCTPFGLLTFHIGDGRAGYKDLNDEWHPLIIPHKGDEANETVFMTSNIFTEETLFMRNVPVPEYNIIRGQVKAFVLLSDGCEMHSFVCSKMDEAAGKCSDPNKPFTRFFEPVIKIITDLNKSGSSQSKLNEEFSNIIASGNKSLENETDDKTMVLGINKNF